MDALTLVLQFVFKSFVVLLPVVVGGLAFRRLTKSKTSNAWIYAVTCLFAAVTAAGLLPWAVGLSASSWGFFVLAAFCPAVWFAVTTICDVSRNSSYETEIEDISAVLFKAYRKAAPAPLLLKEPLKDMPLPVFSHSEPANTDAPAELTADAAPLVATAYAPVDSDEEAVVQPIGEKSVLDVAREMRRNKSSEERRPKLLPPPSISKMPFIKSSSTA